MKKGLFIWSMVFVVILSTTFSVFLPRTTFADFDCTTLSTNATPDQRAYCQNQITVLEQQITELNNQLANQKQQSGTLQGDINLLTTQINSKTKQIKAKILTITQLTDSISEKQTAIESLSEKITREKDSLAQLLRKTNEMDQMTLSNFLLSSSNLSDFYSDVSRFATLQSDVKTSVDTITTIKAVNEQKKTELQQQQDKTLDEKATLESVQQSIVQDQKTQKQLLSISKDKETQYKQVIAGQQAKVAQIKARLFQLAGGSQAIRFDVALRYAQESQSKTGIDPAYLLAELTQESNLGSNVGKCYLTNPDTGAGVNINSGKTYPNVMKPSRDVQPFLSITGSLGFDPYKTVVSCPIAGVAGYGGAMGPAQFIASTWSLFITRIETALSKQTANPWDAEDAFMAASFYLTDLGGTGTSASAQLRASCKYYGSGGSTCSYGRSVQSLKNSIQGDIDYLNQYGVSKR